MIAVILAAAALIAVFEPFSEYEVSQTTEAGRDVGLNSKPAVAGWQTLLQRETAAVLTGDADLSRQVLLASTVQRRQAPEEDTSHRDAPAGEPAAAASAQLQQSLQQERERSSALTAELTRARGDLETMLGLSRKFQDDAMQRWEAAEITAEELRQSLQQEQAHAAALANDLTGMRHEIEDRDAQLQQEQDKTAALSREVGAARQAMAASAEQQRGALDQAQMRAAALASELAGTSSEIETQAAQWQKAVDEAVQQKQTAEATIAELRQSLQQEREKTTALVKEAQTAHEATASAEQQHRALEEAQARAAALASELAEMHREIETRDEGPVVPATRTVSPVTQTVAAAVSEPPTAADQDKAEAARLIARAGALLGQGNIGAARIVLERAAENDSARASFMLAETYDPVVLSAWGTYGTRGDAAKARELYAKAHRGGVREAKDRLDALPR
ncbi:hypothetical protein [Bradyrhizobium cenepequi]|uniref:hypothetical protein n=1 Tax=Bradyrhizobium cenepequi TaxID=2821403 RepID=UPI001CE3618A|nr:hypothetical protein [Bradyrhizobium cenepequi]MCA6112818.1 hypothetical protein [Bradyrhizobium cenepequi]